MDKKEMTKLRNAIAAELGKHCLKHPLLSRIYANETAFKRRYIKSVSSSILVFLLKGRCKIAPEFSYKYIEYLAEEYPEPMDKYQGVFAVNLQTNETVEEVADILKTSFKDENYDFIDEATSVLTTIINHSNL